MSPFYESPCGLSFLYHTNHKLLVLTFVVRPHPTYHLSVTTELSAPASALRMPPASFVTFSNKHLCALSYAASPFPGERLAMNVSRTTSLSSSKSLLKTLLGCDAYKKLDRGSVADLLRFLPIAFPSAPLSVPTHCLLSCALEMSAGGVIASSRRHTCPTPRQARMLKRGCSHSGASCKGAGCPECVPIRDHRHILVTARLSSHGGYAPILAHQLNDSYHEYVCFSWPCSPCSKTWRR